MKLQAILLVAVGLCLKQVSAATWYYLMWLTPSTSAQFHEFSMTMVVPTLPEAATYYLWPGLQDVGTTGVYQEVLDGRSGDWWIGSGWCCSNPSLAWGSGFNVAAGDDVVIDMKRTNDTYWTSTLSQGSQYATNSFPLAYKNFNQAIFAIELYDVTWNFGPLEWTNVKMVMNTTQTAWCTSAPINYNSATVYTMTTPTATTVNGVTTCSIEQIIMESPA